MVTVLFLFLACIIPYILVKLNEHRKRAVNEEERRYILEHRLPANSIVDFPPDPNSPVNYWLQVYAEMQRDLGDIWALTGSVNLPFTQEEYLKFNQRADRLDLNMERLAKLFYRCEGKDLIKGLK